MLILGEGLKQYGAIVLSMCFLFLRPLSRAINEVQHLEKKRRLAEVYFLNFIYLNATDSSLKSSPSNTDTTV